MLSFSWSAKFSLFPRPLTSQAEAKGPALVVEGGPLRGRRPGAATAWLATDATPCRTSSILSDMREFMRGATVFRFGVYTYLIYLRLSAWHLRLRPDFLSGFSPVTLGFP